MNDHRPNRSDDPLLDRLKASLCDEQVPAMDSGWKRGVMAEIHAHAVGRQERLRTLHQALRNGAIAAAAVALVTTGLSLFGGHGWGLHLSKLVALEPDTLLQLVLLF